jgi:GNAT superfamily N-acetyltransferase
MNLNFRVALDSDLLLLAQMNKRLIEDEGSRNRMSIDELQQRMNGWLQGEWTIQLFIEQEMVAGYAVFQVHRDEYDPAKQIVHVRQFYIERENRGRGLGRDMFKALAQAYFPTGSRIVLDVLASNPGGYEFWSKLGFNPHYTHMYLENPAGKE